MARLRAVFAVAVAMACVASASAGMVGIFPGPKLYADTPGSGAEVFVNVTVHFQQGEPGAMNVQDVGVAFVGVFMPYLFANAPCNPDFAPSMDLSAFQSQVTGIAPIQTGVTSHMYMYVWSCCAGLSAGSCWAGSCEGLCAHTCRVDVVTW